MSVSAVVMAIKLGTENGQRVCYEHYLPVYLQIILIGGVVYGCISCSNCPLLLFWTTGMCTEGSLCTSTSPPPSLIFMRGEGRCAQATLKVELDCSGDDKPTYSSTATDPVNNSGVALANHCQSVIFYCFCPVHISKE